MKLPIYSPDQNEHETIKSIDSLRDKLPNQRIDKILFVNPPDAHSDMFSLDIAQRGRYNNNPSYGLGVLASVVRQIEIDARVINLNHEIIKASHQFTNECDDFNFDKVWQEKLQESLLEFQPDIIGITCLFTMTHESFKQVVKFVSKLGYSVIAGGVHVTNDVDRVLQDIPELDAVVLREGEVALRSLLLHINRSPNPPPLGQIVFNQNKNIVKLTNEVRPTVEDFDIHPAMDLMQIEELSKFGCVGAYHYLKNKGAIVSTVLSNRGCRGKCTFCCVAGFNGPGVRKREVASVVDEIERLHDDHGVTHITWLDDDLLADRQRCIHLFQEISKRNLDITWEAANGLIAASCTEDIIQAAAESGCVGLVIGVESGNPSILREIKKPGTVESFIKAAEILKKFPQIYANAFLMIGFPNETFSQIQETIDLALKMDLDWYKINTLQPLPNTPIYNAMLGGGMIEQLPLTKGIHFDKQGGYGKIEEIESNLENINDTVERIFKSHKPNGIPNKKELTNIWFYMVYHLNFERISTQSFQKAQQHRSHLNHISTKVLPEHAFALYYMGVIDSKFNGKLEECLILRLQNQLKHSSYWRERFQAVGLAKSLHPIWEPHLNVYFNM
ncbi:MAG: B12-binding domain-containing radical SAM protein [Candidatus Thorarchaeota archaeon]|jgi:radical SAM superfamily enzyme YgiQ (UPF0313 family)